jgi:hypothetical protein
MAWIMMPGSCVRKRRIAVFEVIVGLEGLGLDIGPIVVKTLGLGILEGEGHVGMEGLVAEFFFQFERTAAEAGEGGLEGVEGRIGLGGDEEYPFAKPVETGELEVDRAESFEKCPQALGELVLLGLIPMEGHLDGDDGRGISGRI